MKKTRKRKKKNDENYEIKFWKDWLEADPLTRLKLIEKLPLFDMCLNMKDEKMLRSDFATLINGYFEDLENAVYTKIRLDRKKSGFGIAKSIGPYKHEKVSDFD